MKHTAPALGCIECRHWSHTGSREIPSRGSLQIRQLEGNKVAKRLSAMPRSESASLFFLPEEADSGNSNWFTATAEDEPPLTSGTTSLQYKVWKFSTQREKFKQQRDGLRQSHDARVLVQISTGSFGESNRHNELRACRARV